MTGIYTGYHLGFEHKTKAYIAGAIHFCGCRDRRYRKTYFAVDNRLYAFVQFDRPKIENHLLTHESMKKKKIRFHTVR